MSANSKPSTVRALRTRKRGGISGNETFEKRTAELESQLAEQDIAKAYKMYAHNYWVSSDHKIFE